VQARRTYERAIAQIADRIRSGDLGVGDRLPGERALADQMEISRPTVREAIRVLSEAGIVTVKPGASGGLYIASDHIPLSLVPSHLEGRSSEIVGVLETRRMLEPHIAQLAALRATDEDFALMQNCIEQQRAVAAAGGDGMRERLFQLDVQFHKVVARATKNPTAVRLMVSLLTDLEAARDIAAMEVSPEDMIEIHQRTLDAIRSGDMALIDVVMDEHLARTEELWERATGRPLVPGVPGFLKPVMDRKNARDAASTHR
jgi:DNA-binding FadR family transcriptional regulator